MKKGLLLFTLALLSACSSKVTTQYYQLAADPGQPVSSSLLATAPRTLFVEPITVPDYLAGNGIAFQSSAVQYSIATNHLWASPLDQQLQQTLVTHLQRELPGWLVTSSQPGSQYDSLTLSVTGFHGRQDGHAVIIGSWIYRHQGEVRRQPFSLVLPQSKDGYDALVNTLSEGWRQEAAQIAAAIG